MTAYGLLHPYIANAHIIFHCIASLLIPGNILSRHTRRERDSYRIAKTLEANIMANLTTWTFYEATLPSQLAAITIAINIFILINNIFVILTFRRMGRLTIQHYYMLGLVGSDLIVFIITLAVAGIELKHEVWVSQTLCGLFGISSAGTANITALIHTAMSIDRWVSVQFPLKYRSFKTEARSSYITVTIIISSFVVGVVYLNILYHFEHLGVYFDPSIPFCIVTTGKRGLLGLMSCTLIFFIMPSTLQALTNIHMLIKVTRLRGASRARTFKSIKTIIATLGVFYLCWFPIGIWLLWDISSASHPNGAFSYFAVRMLLSNSGMSFVIYFRTLPGFKDKFMSMFRCRKGRVNDMRQAASNN